MRAIETRFNGITYRSRLEARWACFFGWVGWRFVYEPEGFEHDAERYLPDFWIDEFDAYVEIKPHNAPEAELERAEEWQRVMTACGQRLTIIEGEPAPDSHKIWAMIPERTAIRLMDCRRCSGISYTFENGWGEFGVHSCGNNCEKEPILDDRVRAAMVYAMAERFGERE
jgi:hypothetical protein